MFVGSPTPHPSHFADSSPEGAQRRWWYITDECCVYSDYVPYVCHVLVPRRFAEPYVRYAGYQAFAICKSEVTVTSIHYVLTTCMYP
jgi:hypothetical protein